MVSFRSSGATFSASYSISASSWARLTLALCTPSVRSMAFVMEETQNEQLIPPILNCSLSVTPDPVPFPLARTGASGSLVRAAGPFV